ncbi:MAG: FAD-dependent oxidoreductase [Clostridia bacterium]|nr:FAD-dependent oxidoreductase [Clostridia bacterium]
MEFVKTYQYDVVVTGGGPAGIGAAVAAARTGAKTALLERSGLLGGMLTLGQVQPILGAVSSGTIYDEIVDLVSRGHEDCPPLTTYIGREVHVDAEECKGRLMQFVAENGVDIFLQTPVFDVLKEGDKVTGVIAGSGEGPVVFMAKTVVDTTGDGYTAVRAGCAFDMGRDDGGCQPTTIEFLIDNIDESCAICCGGGSDPVQLPDGRRYSEVCKAACASGELPENVSIVRLHRTFYPGERNVNATQANGFNTLTAEGVLGAELLLRSQIDKILVFLRKNVPGYEHCRARSSGSVVGVRETRRIRGLSQVKDIDVETGTRSPEVAVHKAWFLIDIHNPKGSGQAEKYSHPCQPYDIPYGALVPCGVDGILVGGRCISGTHRAHASYRVMAICLATGQAAGTAAALCAKEGVQPRELPVSRLQEALKAQGVELFD